MMKALYSLFLSGLCIFLLFGAARGYASQTCHADVTTCSNHLICAYSIESHEWLRTKFSLKYVQEAQRRGLTCNIVKESPENIQRQNFDNDLVYLCESSLDRTQALFYLSEQGTKGTFNNQVFELIRIVDTLLGPSMDGETFLKFDSNKLKLEPDLDYVWTWVNCFLLAENIVSLLPKPGRF